METAKQPKPDMKAQRAGALGKQQQAYALWWFLRNLSVFAGLCEVSGWVRLQGASLRLTPRRP